MQFSQGPCHNERQRLSLQHHHTLPCVRPICYVSTMWPLRRLGGGVGSKSLSRVESVLDFSCICCLAFYPRCQVYDISSCHHVPLTLQRNNQSPPSSHDEASKSQKYIDLSLITMQACTHAKYQTSLRVMLKLSATGAVYFVSPNPENK